MTKTVKRISAKKPSAKTLTSNGKVKHGAKLPGKKPSVPSTGWYRLWMVCAGLAVALLLAYAVFRHHSSVSLMSVENEPKRQSKVHTQAQPGAQPKSSPKSMKKEHQQDDKVTGYSELPQELKDFKLSVQKQLKMTPIYIDRKQIQIKELKHNNPKSTVKAYIIENFLGDYECENLIRIHKKYLNTLNKNDAIMCFDSVDTLRKNLVELKLKNKVSEKDFTEGTTCLNETFSSKLKQYFKWSYSMAFYPGENRFSTMYAKRIEQATGLKEQNGGKFQITAYPVGVGYKSHTDCVIYEQEPEKRDRFATVLVYLQDVEEGGETDFPLLGIKVKPKKGLALVWNSMDELGNCDPMSLHDAKKVTKGHKYIIQRWYYYHNFPALGKRAPEPRLPARKKDQPKVSCDMYEQGSCRWYDEWNYDHIAEYAANTRQWL